MDKTIEYRMDEQAEKRRCRKVFLAFVAPEYVLGLLFILFCITIGLHHNDAMTFHVMVVLLVTVIYLRMWPKTWKAYSEMAKRHGAFEHPMIIHLTDTFFEKSCGESHGKQEYRVYTHYFCLKDHIALLYNRTLGNIIDRKEFPDGGTEWMTSLEACGVKRKCF